MFFGGAGQQPSSLLDRVPVPQRAVLVLQQHQPTVGTEAPCAAGAVEPNKCEQASDFGLRRHQPVEQGRQPLGVIDEIARLSTLGGAQVALIEEQVDHREDLGQAIA